VVRKGTKPGAPAFAERLMPTGICGGRGTYLSRAITPRAAIKGELDLVGYDGKIWHSSKSERAPSGRTCRRSRNLALLGKTTRGGSHGAAISSATSRRRLSLQV